MSTLPVGTYFRKTRAKTGETFGIELRRENIPVGTDAYGPELVTTVTSDSHGSASACHALAAEAYGVPYGAVAPAQRMRWRNMRGVPLVHTFWTVGRQS